jgi:hypothetical protein
MNKSQVDEFVLMLAEGYGKEVSPERVQVYTEVLYEDLEKVGMGAAYKIIMQSCEYFPTPAQILNALGVGSKSDLQEAENFVDRAIFYFQNKPKEAYEALGREGYNLAKAMGLDPYSIKSGLQEPKFLRKQWIDNYKIIKQERQQDNLLPEATRPTLLKGGQNDKADK